MRLARRNGWWSSTAQGAAAPQAPLSAVLMSGGCLHVPDSQYRDLFLPAYARDLEAGVRLSVVERCTPESRWFADLDVYDDPLSAEDWHRVLQALQRALARLLGRADGALPPLVVLGARSGVKTGLHLIAPDTRVPVQTMLEWHGALANALRSACDRVDWAAALDRAVYEGGGSLRMVRSCKMVPCDACRGGASEQRADRADRAACSTCRGAGKVDGGRVYDLELCLDRHGAVDAAAFTAMQRNCALLVRRTSVRVMGFDVAAPQAPPGTRKRPLEARGSDTASSSSGSTPRDLGSLVRGAPAEHAALPVTEIAGRVAGQTLLRLHGSDARFCPFVRRHHRSSTCYYTVHRGKGVAWMRCHCKKGGCEGSLGPLDLVVSRAPAGLPAGFR